jgi:subtilisin family serine protease
MLAILLTAPGSSLPIVQAQPLANVGADVLTTLRAEGSANVVIALNPPPSVQALVPNVAQLRNEVAQVQSRVLAAVNAQTYRARHQFRAVPALSGTILSEAGLRALAAHPDVRRIDLDVGGTGGLGASVPLIGADRWGVTGIGGEGVVVAVLDSGIDTDHSDLADSVIFQACFLDDGGGIDGVGFCPNGSDRQVGPGAAEDNAGHGTHVSGIITANGNVTAPGVAPGAQIVSVKVLDGCSFSGCFYAFTEVVAALDFIITDRPEVKVINMSLGTNALFAGDCDATTAFNIAGAAAIDTLRSLGVIAFASSGNNSSSTQMSSPACLRNVIAVGATDNSDVIRTSANTNSATDILAPGTAILSSGIGNSTFAASGTSMASPHAAGCAALFIQSGVAVTPDQIEARLEASAVQVLDPSNGLTFPRINCSPNAPTAVTLGGPTSGGIGTTYTFTAATEPLTTSVPLNYTWTATDQGVITRTAGLTDTLTFTWDTLGVKTIEVAVGNGSGVVSATHTIDISFVPPAAVNITGPATGTTAAAYTFTAATTPLTASVPLSYTWTATDQTMITRTAELSDSVTFTWRTPGVKTIRVEVTQGDISVTRTYTIRLDQRIFLPLLRS